MNFIMTFHAFVLVMVLAGRVCYWDLFLQYLNSRSLMKNTREKVLKRDLLLIMLIHKRNTLQTFLLPPLPVIETELIDFGEEKSEIDLIKQELDKLRGENSKLEEEYKLNPRDQLFMLLSWLKMVLLCHMFHWLFDTPKSTVILLLIIWINILYMSLGNIPTWPSRQQINETMPESFKKTYPTTRCILDCTELFCHQSGSLSVQSSLYSSYKHHIYNL